MTRVGGVYSTGLVSEVGDNPKSASSTQKPWRGFLAGYSIWFRKQLIAGAVVALSNHARNLRGRRSVLTCCTVTTMDNC